MSNEIELYSKLNLLEAVTTLGRSFAKSCMAGCDRAEQGELLAWECLTTRKSPLEIIRRNHIYDGRLSMKSETMLADFRSQGGKHKIISRTPEKAEIELTKDGNTQRFAFTWEEAQQEPFVKGKDGFKKNWATPRARMQMLWARVVSDSVRALAPEIVVGVYTPEELDDSPEKSAAPLLKLKEAEPAKETVREAEVISQTDSTGKPPADAPKETATAAAQTVTAALDSRTGKLNMETLLALSLVLPEDGDKAEKAIAWCKARGWIKAGGFEELNAKRAQSILNRPTNFLKTIGASDV